MDDSLSLYELPRAMVKPTLELCRGFNSALDKAFYDVGAFEADMKSHGAAANLAAGSNPEGAILVVDAAFAPFVSRFDDFCAFVDWWRAAETKPICASITGVGSSALGSAALAWDISRALKAPVIAIVPGYGVADAVLQGLGGWFGFGLHNALGTKSQLQDVFAMVAPDVASVGRKLAGSIPGSRKLNGAPVFQTGSGSSDVLHALMGEIELHCVVGHSKGALAIADALRSLPAESTQGLNIVTLGCPVATELAGATYHQYLGLFDALGQANSWGNPPGHWLATDHSTNTALPLSMNAETLMRRQPPAVAPPSSRSSSV